MDLALRNITRRLVAGDITAVSDFITYSYRQGHRPQRTFDELSNFIGTDDAEIALTAHHDATRDSLFNMLRNRNAEVVIELTNIFSEREWIRHNTKLWEGFPEVNYDIRVTGICDRCEGTGIPVICGMCEVEYPCPHFNTQPRESGNKIVVSPTRIGYHSNNVIYVICPYCGKSHLHTFASPPDTQYRMSARQSDCYPGGKYEIQFTPNCSCILNKGIIITKTFHVFREAFYRHVWANLHPPGIEINPIMSGKDFCNRNIHLL